jgi:pilus assembly protein CpaD
VRDYHEQHPIVLAQAPTSLDVYAIGGSLDSQSAANVRAFAQRYSELGSGQIAIITPAGRPESSAKIIGDIRRTLYSSGLRGYVSVTSYPVPDPERAAPIHLVFRGLRAIVPGRCGQWPTDLASGTSLQEWKNEAYPNFGCATQSVLAAQVADPRDLAEARATSAPDVQMRLRAIGDVRNGQDPGTSWKTQTTTIGSVGSGG